MDLLGQELDGYFLTALIDQGGMGQVYHAVRKNPDPESIEPPFAVKVLSPELVSIATIKRLNQEIKTLYRLQGIPHIITIVDHGAVGNIYYIVTVYYSGGTLAHKIKNNPLEISKAIEILRPIANALDKAHKKNIVHRDIKPSNILFNEDGDPYLSDFGIAYDTEVTQHLVETSGIIGTLSYMAPEVFRGERANERSDFFSLGLTAYEMLSGTELKRAGIDSPILSKLFKVNSLIPLAVDNVIARMIDNDPGKRFSSASDFVDALASASKEKPVRQPFVNVVNDKNRKKADPEDDKTTERIQPTPQEGTGSKPKPWRAIALVIVVLVILTIVAVYLLSRLGTTGQLASLATSIPTVTEVTSTPTVATATPTPTEVTPTPMTPTETPTAREITITPTISTGTPALVRTPWMQMANLEIANTDRSVEVIYIPVLSAAWSEGDDNSGGLLDLKPVDYGQLSECLKISWCQSTDSNVETQMEKWVVKTPWYAAQRFCKWRNNGRLPTAAELESAQQNAGILNLAYPEWTATTYSTEEDHLLPEFLQEEITILEVMNNNVLRQYSVMSMEGGMDNLTFRCVSPLT